ncbi:MAG: flagellar motor protein [Zoogloeaceae bacterium]|jgi:chemotaxis protein MotA|nr:flagellar motor protein [Zoogloeaceae bacterium]
MDKLSLFGLLAGLGAIAAGQALEGGNLLSLAQPTALVIVLGGTLGAVMLQTPFAVFRRGLAMSAWVFFPPRQPYQEVIAQVIRWSHLARREGLLALEKVALETDDFLARRGLQLLADGVDESRLRGILEVALDAREDNLRQSARVWEAAGGYSPTIGILGAVLGLIHVMENLTDPSKLGAGIAVAFVATIYGVGLANLVYLPIFNKLKSRIAEEIRAREIVLDGLSGISLGENPRIIENRLMGYLAQDEPSEKRPLRGARR